MTAPRKRRKEQVGVVVSDRMTKTVVVRVETRRRHPLYGKTVRYVKKYKAHDESQTSRVGDRVVITETRPLSKEKRWRVVQVLERGALGAVPKEVAEATGASEGGA